MSVSVKSILWNFQLSLVIAVQPVNSGKILIFIPLLFKTMASVINFPVSPSFVINSQYKTSFRARAQSVGGGDSTVLSSGSIAVNGDPVSREKEKNGALIDVGNGTLKPRVEKKKLVKNVISEELEVLWDDGYGTDSVKDYLDAAKEIIKPDGGPPRWFCPVDCGRPLKGSPTLLFLPGNCLSHQVDKLMVVKILLCSFFMKRHVNSKSPVSDKLFCSLKFSLISCELEL